jgi:hypothetical protein
MTEREAGNQLARLLLPYCRREWESADGPDHEIGWWFTAAPPAVVREALALVVKDAGERPNDQPPEDWLVTQADRRGGVLAGYAAPAGPDSPRMRVDAIIVPTPMAGGLADEIESQWPIEGGGTALDLAVVEGLDRQNTTRMQWAMPGRELRNPDTRNCLNAEFCSFWWD